MTCRIAVMMAMMLAGSPWIASKVASAGLAQPARTVTTGRMSPWLVQITPRNGRSRLATLDGVGCSETICSRVSVRTRAVGNSVVVRTSFDTITAIKMVADGEATIEFKDGTSRRVSVAPDNRVLYLIDADGRTQKVDLGEVVALEFLGREKQ